MEKKINLVELLKDCPTGMELDCTMFNEVVKFDGIDKDGSFYPIRVKIKNNTEWFDKYGCFSSRTYAKCVIFPKGKTTWEGFVPPCKFKDGDILYIDCADEESDGDLYKFIFILKEIDSLGNHYSYCHLNMDVFFSHSYYLTDNDYTPRLATEEEKEKLFKAIKENGYKWNPGNKTLEKLPKFKDGDRIKNRDNGRSSSVVEVKDDYFIIKTLDGFGHSYLTDKLPLSKQDEYELVPNKFDITTLKPFDKVLVRYDNSQRWVISFFSHYNGVEKHKYYCINGCRYAQCIPYENNEHLLDTEDNCNDFYKTWK